MPTRTLPPWMQHGKGEKRTELAVAPGSSRGHGRAGGWDAPAQHEFDHIVHRGLLAAEHHHLVCRCRPRLSCSFLGNIPVTVTHHSTPGSAWAPDAKSTLLLTGPPAHRSPSRYRLLPRRHRRRIWTCSSAPRSHRRKEPLATAVCDLFYNQAAGR